MKVGDLVLIKDDCPHWVRRPDDKIMLSVVRGFEQDLELDENCEYMWRVHLTTTCGLSFWVHRQWLEVLCK